MSVFAIADLHLAHTANKPMDIFGAKWEHHTEKIRKNWLETVSDTDTVVIAGDISWGLRIEEAEEDFRFLEALPGRKLILKGNHDYWWQTMKKLQEFRDRVGATSVDFLFNNAFLIEDFVICGTRGWLLETQYGEADAKIVHRETERLRLSLDAGDRLLREHPDKERLIFLHYPPAYGRLRCQPICELLQERGAKRVFYGHMHNADPARLIRQIAGASCELIAADALQFCPKRIVPVSN